MSVLLLPIIEAVALTCEPNPSRHPCSEKHPSDNERQSQGSLYNSLSNRPVRAYEQVPAHNRCHFHLTPKLYSFSSRSSRDPSIDHHSQEAQASRPSTLSQGEIIPWKGRRQSQ